MGSGDDPISLGVTFSESKQIHINSFYDIRTKIATVIESAALNGRSVDYESVISLVELAISLIPSMEQGNKCLELLDKKYKEALNELAAEHGGKPTAADIMQAKKRAAMITLRAVQMIFDTDLGIRIQHSVGVA